LLVLRGMNSKPARSLRLVTYAAALAVVGAAAEGACSLRSDEPGATESAVGTATSLDTMDVAILLPIPTNLALADGMLSPSLPTASGKPLLSRETFTSILDARTAKDADGHLVKSGINLSGKRSTLKAKSNFFNFVNPGPVEFGKYEQWKIISTRLEPCAPTQTMNHAVQPALSVGDTFDPSKCSAHLNVVIQPMVRGTQETQSTFFGTISDVLTMGDYAIHLLFELTQPEMRAAAQDFLGLKNACAALAQTDGEPLGVHPCLAKEATAAKELADLTQHKRLAGILGKYGNKLVNAAVMGTDLGLDPWMFYPGNVKDGVFEPVRVFTVAKDPASAPIDNHGKKVRLPFDNARYQMLTLLMADGSDVANPIVPNSADGRDSIVYSFASTFRKSVEDPFSGDPGLANQPAFQKQAKDTMDKLETNIHHLENPARNDFFSVDCVSCHTSTEHENQLLKRSFVGPSGTKFSSLKGSAQFRGLGTTTAIRPEALQQGRGTVLNFAYRFNVPSVSRRVAYEASLSAAMLNRSFLVGATPKSEECPQKELATCLELAGDSNALALSGPSMHVVPGAQLAMARARGDAVIAQCKTLVCTEKSTLTRLTPRTFATLRWSTGTPGGADAGAHDGGLGAGTMIQERTVAAGGEAYVYLPPVLVSGTAQATLMAVRPQASRGTESTSRAQPRLTINLDEFNIER
jgi:hypothetical protein